MKNMDKGILTNADMKKPKYKFLYAFMLFVMVIYCFISAFPVIWVLLSGFKDVKEMYSVPATLLPKNIDLHKLVKLWNEMKFYKYYANTFIMAGGAVAAQLLVSGLAGYVLSRLKPKGTKVMLAVVFWLMLLPGTMNTVPLYMEFKSMNLLDTYWPIWLMAAVNLFNVILFKNFFDGISSALVEAAWVDGASNARVFLQIILPLSVPVFIVVGMFTFNGSIGNFLWPYLVISDKSKRVLGVVLYNMKGSSYTMDEQMLALIFSVLPQVIIFAIFQKQIIGGVNVGGVKG